MTNPVILGIDPGLDGGFVAVTASGAVVFKSVMPIFAIQNTRFYRLSGINDIFAKVSPASVFLEKPLMMPGNGRRAYGMMMRCEALIEAACFYHNAPFNLVSPNLWVKEMLRDYPKEKKASVLFATRRYPQEDWRGSEKAKNLHTGLTDALCIALYGLKNSKSLLREG